MRALARKASVVQHQNFVCKANRRRALGNDHNRRMPRQLPQRPQAAGRAAADKAASAAISARTAAAKSRNTDILLIDTAGRLHNKKNLMDELAKMRRIITREYPEANVESLIVLDGTTGQNALEQARQFSSVTEINGIIITKLDGTAKGGIAIAIQSELNVPVKYIGIGEQIDDLQKFDPNSYVNALFADFDMRSDVEILVDENIENIPKDDDLFDMN